MRINPVLRNESKLAARTPKFTILLFIYIAILTAGVLLFYNLYSETVYTNGLDLQSSIMLYFGMAIGQAALLMFIVPALTSTAICSEREKQTLDMLLSSKLTPLQIIIGKLASSSIKVIMLIICTMPIYAVCGLTGGVRLCEYNTLNTVLCSSYNFCGINGCICINVYKNFKGCNSLNLCISIIYIYRNINNCMDNFNGCTMKSNGSDATRDPMDNLFKPINRVYKYA